MRFRVKPGMTFQRHLDTPQHPKDTPLYLMLTKWGIHNNIIAVRRNMYVYTKLDGTTANMYPQGFVFKPTLSSTTIVIMGTDKSF